MRKVKSGPNKENKEKLLKFIKQTDRDLFKRINKTDTSDSRKPQPNK